MNKLILYQEFINGYDFTVSKTEHYIKFEFEDSTDTKHLMLLTPDTFFMMCYKFLPECITMEHNIYGKNKLFELYYKKNQSTDSCDISLKIGNGNKYLELWFDNEHSFQMFVHFMKKSCFEIWFEEN